MKVTRHGYSLIEMLAVISLLMGLALSGVRCFTMIQQINQRRDMAQNERSEIERFASLLRSDISHASQDSQLESHNWPIEILHPGGLIVYSFDSSERAILRSVNIEKDTEESGTLSRDRFQLRPDTTAMVSTADGWLSILIVPDWAIEKNNGVAAHHRRYVIEVRQ